MKPNILSIIVFNWLLTIASLNHLSAQVTFLDSSVVTNDAFYFWKANDPKPYHYARAINPHGNCIKVYNGYVFYTWYRGGWNDRTLMVSRKKIGEGKWKHVALPGKLSLVNGKGDTHLTTNIGICPIDGTIHIMYDHHNEDLNYIRSKKNIAFGPDSDFVKANFLPQQDYLIPGKKITGVSYPNMFNNDAGEMFFERRLGSAVGGEIIITYYDGNGWSPQKTIIDGRKNVTQGERNFCYGKPISGADGKMYYTYSPRWAESPTRLNEGVYLMELGKHMNNKATNVNGQPYNLPVTNHAPFFIADPRSEPTTAGWSGGPDVAVSPKGDIYLKINPKNTDQYNYLRKAGEKEFTEYRKKGSLGKFYGNRMYKFVEKDGYLKVLSCLAGTFNWRVDYELKIGSRLNKSRVIMQDGYIAAVYKEEKNSEKVPIHCYVFKIEKSDYKPQTINLANIPSKTEGAANFVVSATATSGLPVILSSSNTNIARIVDGNKVKTLGVGTCDIIANQPGNGEYDSASEVRKSFTVKANTAKQNQNIQFDLGLTNYRWNGGDINLNASASSGLKVKFESSDTNVAKVVNGRLKVKRAGTTTISALQMGNSNYNAAPIVGHLLNVPKQQQIITVESLPKFESGDKNHTINATSNNPNVTLRYTFPNDQVAIVWTNSIRECLGKGSGTLTISAPEDEFFTSAEVKKTITVEAKIHVLPKKIEAEYYTKKSGVNVTRWSNSIFYLNSWGAKDYAEYTIDVSARGKYEVEIRAASPAAGKKLKLQVGSNTLATATLVKTPNLTNFKSTKVKVNLEAGIQTLKVVGVGYNLDWLNFKALEVDKLSANVTAPANNSTFKLGESITLKANATGAAKVNFRIDGEYYMQDDTAPYEVTWTPTEAKTYTIDVAAFDAANSKFVSTGRTVTITSSKSQTITFPEISNKRLFDPVFPAGATSSSGLNVWYSSSDESIADVNNGNIQIKGLGTVTITAHCGGNETYEAAPNADRTFTVNKALQTITFPSIADKTTLDENFAAGATASSGLNVWYSSSDTSVAKVSGGMVSIQGPGTVTITAHRGKSDEYEAASEVSRTFSVNKVSQTITFPVIADKKTSDPDFAAGATSSSGLTVAYSSSDNAVASVTNGTIQINGIGEATITATCSANDVYQAANPVSQTFTVSGPTSPPSIVFSQPNGNVNVNDGYALTAVVDASDSDGEIDNVKLYIEGELVRQEKVAPYEWGHAGSPNPDELNNLAPGKYEIKAIATDNDGLSSSAIFTLTVNAIPITVDAVDAEQAPNVATNLLDGNINDNARWSAKGFPKSVMFDLGISREITGTNMWTYLSRPYQYTIEVSPYKNSGFSIFVDKTNNTSNVQPLSDNFTATGRYVKLSITGAHNYDNDWVSINEFEILINGKESALKSITYNNARSNKNVHNNFSIYPNPASFAFSIYKQGVDIIDISIYNMQGKRVYQNKNTEKLAEIPVTKTFAKGVYIIRVTNKNQHISNQKLIIE